eukprot:1161976-Pelagomonas_calceolata.AAC.17
MHTMHWLLTTGSPRHDRHQSPVSPHTISFVTAPAPLSFHCVLYPNTNSSIEIQPQPSVKHIQAPSILDMEA